MFERMFPTDGSDACQSGCRLFNGAGAKKPDATVGLFVITGLD